VPVALGRAEGLVADVVEQGGKTDGAGGGISDAFSPADAVVAVLDAGAGRVGESLQASAVGIVAIAEAALQGPGDAGDAGGVGDFRALAQALTIAGGLGALGDGLALSS